VKIKFRLSIAVIATVTIVAIIMAVLLVREASRISLSLARKNMRNLTQSQVEYWKGRQESNLKILKTLADVMADYENTPVETRRDRYDSILRSTLLANSNFAAIYTVWKPNAVDGMDAAYVGRPGSTPTGQYASAFVENNGSIAQIVTSDVDGAMNHITNPKARNDRVLLPQPFIVNGKDTWVIRFFVPIYNQRINEVVGGVGCFIDIAQIQPIVLNTINSSEEVSGITIYASNGRILGHTVTERIGKMLLDVDTIYGPYMQEANHAVFTGREFQCRTYSPALKMKVETLILSFPIGNSDQTWSILMVVSEKYILKEVNSIIRFTIILAVMAIAAMAVIMYFVLKGTPGFRQK